MGEGGQHSDHIKNYLLLQKVSCYKRQRETVGKHFEESFGRDLNLWLNDWLNKEKIKWHQQMGKNYYSPKIWQILKRLFFVLQESLTQIPQQENYQLFFPILKTNLRVVLPI